MKVAKDIILTFLIIPGLFTLLNVLTALKPVSGIQESKNFTLLPQEGFLRGNLKIDDDNGITNWRSNKNIVHWKINCDRSGTYEINLIHKVTKSTPGINLNISGQTFHKAVEKNSSETKIGKIDLKPGTYSVALYSPDLQKTARLPTIYSIIFTQIN